MEQLSLPPQPASPPSGARRRGHIVISLLAVLVFVGLAPMASIAYKLIDINREALQTAQQEFQLLLAGSIAHELDGEVEGLRARLRQVAGVLALRQSAEADVRRELVGLLDDRLLYLRYDYFRQQGVHGVSAGELPEALEPLFAEGLRDSAEALAAAPSHERVSEPRLSEPILLGDPAPRAVLVVSAPVLAGGSFRGVLSALVDLDAVWQDVALARRKRTGYALFAVSPEGHVFASNDPLRAALGEDARDSELVRRFLSGDGRASETMPFELEREGNIERLLGSYERTVLGWGIFVQAPESQVYWTVQRMKGDTFRLALYAIGLAALAALVFAPTLSKPINRLAAASRAFARGDFSARVHVRSRNEIGELADTFNRMAAEIEDHIRRLRRAAEENKELFLGTIRALAQAIDAKDPYTRGHSVRVNRYSVILATELGLPDEEVRQIHVASLLHDVGKIGIDDVILKKPGTLTPEEFEAMKAHPVLGANIMAPIAQMKPVLPGLRHHHERWKGGGYPDGLRGEDIPLMARIIAVADTFDAITTNRPYQRKMTPDQALARLNELKGEVLDERVVEAFNRAWRADRIAAVLVLGNENAVPDQPALAVGS